MQDIKANKKQIQKQSQDGIFYNITRSICPVCKSVIDAQIIFRGTQSELLPLNQQDQLTLSIIVQ